MTFKNSFAIIAVWALVSFSQPVEGPQTKPFTITRGTNVPFTGQEASAVLTEGTRILATRAGVPTYVQLNFSGLLGTFNFDNSVVDCKNLKNIFAIAADAIVVTKITCCGGEKVGIVGCSGPHRPIIVLAADDSNVRGRAVQWMHELGHHHGLCHRAEGNALMYPTPGLGSTQLLPCESKAFMEGGLSGECRRSCDTQASQMNILEFVHHNFIEGIPYRPDIQYSDHDLHTLDILLNDPHAEGYWLTAVIALGMTGDRRVLPLLVKFLDRDRGAISLANYEAKSAVPVALGYYLAKNFNLDLFNYLTQRLDPLVWSQRIHWHRRGMDDNARNAHLIEMTLMGLGLSGRPEAGVLLQNNLYDLLLLARTAPAKRGLIHARIAAIHLDQTFLASEKYMIEIFNEALRINSAVQTNGSLSEYYRNSEQQQLGFHL